MTTAAAASDVVDLVAAHRTSASAVVAGTDDEPRSLRHALTAGARASVLGLVTEQRPDELYRVQARHGVTVVAVPTTGLTDAELGAVLRFRFAAYLHVGFIDGEVACRDGVDAEPTDVVTPGDVHIVAADAATGQILAYTVIEAPPCTPTGTRMRHSGRALFPVEQVHGAGVYRRLPILPDLAVAKVREVGRFVRSQDPTASRVSVARAVVETGVALFRVMTGPLRLDVDAVVGDLEEKVAKNNLDFFNVPSVVLHHTVPFSSTDAYLSPRYQHHEVHPFAVFVSDVTSALSRLSAVEHALERPDAEALSALRELGNDTSPRPSSFQPDPRPQDPATTWLGTPMEVRGRWREDGEVLRRIDVLAGLSAAEATRLAAAAEPVRVRAGERVASRGSSAELLLVLEGELVHAVEPGAGCTCTSVCAGGCCGQDGVLTDGEHRTDVVAVTDSTLLRLSAETYATHLAHLPEVELDLLRSAVRHLAAMHRSCRPARDADRQEDGT